MKKIRGVALTFFAQTAPFTGRERKKRETLASPLPDEEALSAFGGAGIFSLDNIGRVGELLTC